MANFQDNGALFSLNLAELSDMPERACLPAGTHLIMITGFDAKSDTDDQDPTKHKHLIVVKGKFQSTLEYSDAVNGPTQAPDDGAEVEFGYAMHSDFGQGAFKKAWFPFANEMGWASLEQLRDGCVNNVLQITTSRRAQKDDKTKFNHNIEAVKAG